MIFDLLTGNSHICIQRKYAFIKHQKNFTHVHIISNKDKYSFIFARL